MNLFANEEIFDRAIDRERQREDDLRRQFTSIIHQVRIKLLLYKKKQFN